MTVLGYSQFGLLCALTKWQSDKGFFDQMMYNMLSNIKPVWKHLSGTNTLAYFAGVSVTKKKHYNIDSMANVIKLLPVIIYEDTR
jgi:hypothetical protein